MNSLRKPIAKIPWIFGSNSQLGQESFVLFVMQNKRKGYFLEIGAYHSTKLSNTAKLERNFEWNGIAIEIDAERSKEYSLNRSSICLNLDALKLDYDVELIKQGAPICIDFLQVDIEPPKNSFFALKKALSSKFSFNVVTFEHDLYASRFNYIWKWAAYFLLKSHGFRLCIENVSNGSARQEDWYIHRRLKSKYRGPKNQSFTEIFVESYN